MTDPLLLVGAGPMARAYAKVLEAEGAAFQAVARGPEKAASFHAETGVRPAIGGLRAWLRKNRAPETAIVAVGVEGLADAASALLAAGTRRLLVEKPGGLDLAQIRRVAAAAARRRARVFVGYNRRFHASTAAARRLIAEDGGAVSCRFEFTEWSARVAASAASPAVKRAWLLANSSHVVDLAFFLVGAPRSLFGVAAGRLPWHAKAVFAGCGLAGRGVPFSYHADWLSPGRWGVEVMTRRRRLILRPLEQLWLQESGSAAPAPAPLDDADDRRFKPGLRRQVAAFLGAGTGLATISEQAVLARWVQRIAAPGRSS